MFDFIKKVGNGISEVYYFVKSSRRRIANVGGVITSIGAATQIDWIWMIGSAITAVFGIADAKKHLWNKEKEKNDN